MNMKYSSAFPVVEDFVLYWLSLARGCVWLKPDQKTVQQQVPTSLGMTVTCAAFNATVQSIHVDLRFPSSQDEHIAVFEARFETMQNRPFTKIKITQRKSDNAFLVEYSGRKCAMEGLPSEVYLNFDLKDETSSSSARVQAGPIRILSRLRRKGLKFSEPSFPTVFQTFFAQMKGVKDVFLGSTEPVYWNPYALHESEWLPNMQLEENRFDTQLEENQANMEVEGKRFDTQLEENRFDTQLEENQANIEFEENRFDTKLEENQANMEVEPLPIGHADLSLAGIEGFFPNLMGDEEDGWIVSSVGEEEVWIPSPVNEVGEIDDQEGIFSSQTTLSKETDSL